MGTAPNASRIIELNPSKTSLRIPYPVPGTIYSLDLIPIINAPLLTSQEAQATLAVILEEANRHTWDEPIPPIGILTVGPGVFFRIRSLRSTDPLWWGDVVAAELGLADYFKEEDSRSPIIFYLQEPVRGQIGYGQVRYSSSVPASRSTLDIS